MQSGSYPQYILNKAAQLSNDDETIETKFYPLYCKILTYWFPPADGYEICPKWTIPGSYNSTITLVIEHSRHPLLLIEIMPPSVFHRNSGRSAADLQVIECLDKIGPTNEFADRFYAVSAIGKRWRACYALKGQGSEGGHPVTGIAAADSLKATSPECWNQDIASAESWEALQSIVETIKGYAQQ